MRKRFTLTTAFTGQISERGLTAAVQITIVWYRECALYIEAPNGLRITRAAPLEREYEQAVFVFQNRADLARRAAASGACACWADDFALFHRFTLTAGFAVRSLLLLACCLRSLLLAQRGGCKAGEPVSGVCARFAAPQAHGPH